MKKRLTSIWGERGEGKKGRNGEREEVYLIVFEMST